MTLLILLSRAVLQQVQDFALFSDNLTHFFRDNACT